MRHITNYRWCTAISVDEALESVRRAIEINPSNTMARFRVSNYLAWQGHFDEALSILKTVPRDVSPFLVDRVRAEILIQTGRLDEAGEIVDRYLATHPKDEGGSFTSVQALILAKTNRKEESAKSIARCAGMDRGLGHYHHTAYNLASAYAASNEPKKAVKWLEAAAADGFPCYRYFKVDPNLDALRGHTIFVEWMSEMETQWNRFKRLA